LMVSGKIPVYSGKPVTNVYQCRNFVSWKFKSVILK
jgi:hypothetical protein